MRETKTILLQIGMLAALAGSFLQCTDDASVAGGDDITDENFMSADSTCMLLCDDLSTYSQSPLFDSNRVDTLCTFQPKETFRNSQSNVFLLKLKDVKGRVVFFQEQNRYAVLVSANNTYDCQHVMLVCDDPSMYLNKEIVFSGNLYDYSVDTVPVSEGQQIFTLCAFRTLASVITRQE